MKAFFAGVDVGSACAKAIVVDGGGRSVGWSVIPTGLDLAGAGSLTLRKACHEAGIELGDLSAIVSTGYGRDEVAGTKRTRSEILCLAKGAFAHCRRAMTVVDIGGQDSKVVFLNERGERTDYRMNRKCAAGTGSFLEIVSMRLGISLDQLGPLAENTGESAPLSSFCSVFASTEVLDLLRRGFSLEAIARGVYRSVAQRVTEMGAKGSYLALAGGVVAHHPVLVDLIREMTGAEVAVLPHPQHVGAFGAAVLAREGGRASIEGEAIVEE
jgi:predicted CoA-substrate-specific enzyme activase